MKMTRDLFYVLMSLSNVQQSMGKSTPEVHAKNTLNAKYKIWLPT